MRRLKQKVSAMDNLNEHRSFTKRHLCYGMMISEARTSSENGVRPVTPFGATNMSAFFIHETSVVIAVSNI